MRKKHYHNSKSVYAASGWKCGTSSGVAQWATRSGRGGDRSDFSEQSVKLPDDRTSRPASRGRGRVSPEHVDHGRGRELMQAPEEFTRVARVVCAGGLACKDGVCGRPQDMFDLIGPCQRVQECGARRCQSRTRCHTCRMMPLIARLVRGSLGSPGRVPECLGTLGAAGERLRSLDCRTRTHIRGELLFEDEQRMLRTAGSISCHRAQIRPSEIDRRCSGHCCSDSRYRPAPALVPRSVR